MAIKKERILSFLYSKSIRSEMLTIAIGLIGPTTKLQLTYRGDCDAAYTTITGKDHDTFRIVLGGGMVAKGAMLPDMFADKESLRPYLSPIKIVFKALNYHELGHVLFTDMSLAPLLEYDEKYHGFLMNLFNVLEDPVIELKVIKYVETTRPYDRSPRRYIDYLKKQMFEHLCEDYKDTGNIESFLQYLLLLLRCGKRAIPSENAVFEKYKESLNPMFKDILAEPDATERQVKTVKLADWMIHNISEFDWSEYIAPPPDLKPSVTGARGKTVGVGGSSASRASAKLSAEDLPDLGEDGDPSGSSDGSKEGADGEESSEKKTESPKRDGDKKDSSFSESDASDEFVIDECFDDLLNASYSHEFVIAKDEYTVVQPAALEEGLNEQLEKTRDCVRDIAKFLTLFNGRKKPRNVGGFASGKLNIHAAMQDEARGGYETKLFDRRLPRGKMADLAVSLVCDNSGSMRGLSSTIASTAALALAQACEWSKIPFECSCFTKTYDNSSGTSITIIEKSFTDTFEKAKPFFGINDSTLIRMLQSERNIPTFRGNSEEVNLFHIGNNFAKCKHATKLMFVFCDGETTGSVVSLKEVVHKMEKDGIYVIGIGIMADRVAEIYPHSRIFKSMDELQNQLAPYLVDTMSKFATK